MDDYVYELVVNDLEASYQIKAWFWNVKYVLKSLIWRTKFRSCKVIQQSRSIRQYFENPPFLKDASEEETLQFWSYCDYWYFYSTEYLEECGLSVTENLSIHNGHYSLMLKTIRAVTYESVSKVIVGCLETASEALSAKLIEFEYPLLFRKEEDTKIYIVFGMLTLCLLADKLPAMHSITQWFPRLLAHHDDRSKRLRVRDTRRGPNGTLVVFCLTVLKLNIPDEYLHLKLKMQRIVYLDAKNYCDHK